MNFVCKLNILFLSVSLGFLATSHAQYCQNGWGYSGGRCQKVYEVRREMRGSDGGYGRSTGYYDENISDPYPAGYELNRQNYPRACYTNGKDNTIKGGLLGAALGALAGVLISKNDSRGALIGAAGGAGLGALLGNSVDRQEDVQACLLGVLCTEFKQDLYYYVSKHKEGDPSSDNHYKSHQTGSLYGSPSIRCRQYDAVVYNTNNYRRGFYIAGSGVAERNYVQFCLIYDDRSRSYIWEQIDEYDFAAD